MTARIFLALAALCLPLGPAPHAQEAEPGKVEPAKAEPAKAEPAKAEPGKVEPAKADPGKVEPAKADPRAMIAGKLPGARVEDVRPTPIEKLYELTRGTDIAYVTADGKYAISGDLIDLNSNDNLTEHHRRELRAHAISAIPESDMVIFGPRDEKYTVTVFTDVDCAYCRQLHSQIAEYNRLGIRVRYLFYPRTGPDTDAWTKAEQVWCSENRNQALTQAKQGLSLKAKPCANNPVARHYSLGRQFDLEGTPAIVMASGELLPGYVPPAALAQRLKEDR